jgi:hypothetical protein
MKYTNTTITFSGELSSYQPIEVFAFHCLDALNAIKYIYPDLEGLIYNLFDTGIGIILKVNGVVLESTPSLLDAFNEDIVEIEIGTIVNPQGNVGKFVIGIGLGVLAISGVGLLGLSTTALGLLGASLVFSSVFKVPKSDTTKEPDKRSINFSGTVNTVGGSQPVPLIFGQEVWCGSIVISADITPVARSV